MAYLYLWTHPCPEHCNDRLCLQLLFRFLGYIVPSMVSSSYSVYSTHAQYITADAPGWIFLTSLLTSASCTNVSIIIQVIFRECAEPTWLGRLHRECHHHHHHHHHLLQPLPILHHLPQPQLAWSAAPTEGSIINQQKAVMTQRKAVRKPLHSSVHWSIHPIWCITHFCAPELYLRIKFAKLASHRSFSVQPSCTCSITLRQDPLEAILVIFGHGALIFFLFESSWKKMKNDATFVRMRCGDHLGDAKMSKKGTSLRRI